MRAIRGISLYFSLISWMFFCLLGTAQAKLISLAEQPDSIVTKIPSDIFDDLFPQGTPAPTPTAVPTATPDVPEPEGYQMDANDYLAVITSDGLKLNLDGLALENLPGYSMLRFEMSPKGDADPMALYLSLYAKPEGKYDLRLADFDPAQYSVLLKISGVMGEKSYDLQPHARILFPAQYFEGILFDGDQSPAAGEHPSHYLAMNAEAKTILAGVGGKIVMESRPVPGTYTPPPPGGNSGNNVPLGPSGGNPSTSNPPGGSLDEGPQIPAGFEAGLGGSGILSCGLSPGGLPSGAWLGGAVFFLSFVGNLALRLRGRTK